MSTLHNLSDSDPIWDAVYDQDEFIHYDRSETGPLLRLVAAELRRIASTVSSWAIAAHLRARADELDPPSSSRTNGDQETTDA